MKFYKVKEYHDFSSGEVLVKNELLTKEEMKGYPIHWFEPVECAVSQTYWFFGARFQSEEEV